jgi:hypothetical protein
MASYATVETALARLHDANPEVQRGAFRGRLKHLQRLGIPLGERPGKGSRINYSCDQIWQLAVALELAEVGIDPAIISNIFKRSWNSSISIMVDEAIEKSADSDEILEAHVSLMSSAWTGQDVRFDLASRFFPRDKNRQPDRDKRRTVTINLRNMVDELTQHFSNLGVDLRDED